ncbi:hypothetical protein, partial [Pseudomonas canadensis]|uniref:hypothetical protein n=1 Tax=Pseudomonas canadensis TaxID=915099 RepID=UPI002B2491C6
PCESRSSSRLNSETPFAKADGVLFWAVEKQKASISTTFNTKVPRFYAMTLRMAIMRASL